MSDKKYVVRGADNINLRPCDKQTRVYADERNALMALSVIADIADDSLGKLVKRAELVKGLKADLGMLRFQAKNVFNQILQTIPDEQLKTLVNNLHDSTYATGVRSPVKKRGDFGMWISFDDIETICEALRDNVCLICSDECNCKMRKVLDRLGTDIEHDGGHCGYRMV